MRNKVVTVFGGSGFIGRYVVQRLAELGATIRVPTRRPERALFLKPMGAIGQINLLRWSPSAPGEVDRLLAGAEAAVSLVGILHEGRMLLQMPVEDLKAGVKMLRLGADVEFLPGLTILERRRLGREWLLTVRDYSPDSVPPATPVLEVIDLTLEEIFVALLNFEEAQA